MPGWARARPKFIPSASVVSALVKCTAGARPIPMMVSSDHAPLEDDRVQCCFS